MTSPPPGPPPDQPPVPPGNPPGYPPATGYPTAGYPQPGYPPYPPPGHPEAPTQHIPAHDQPPEPEGAGRRWWSDPLSIGLIAVIMVAVTLAGLLGAELYARNRADTIVAKAVSCVVQDSATASFGLRPFLIQHFTHSYRDMRVETAGNRIREAQGMKLTLRLDDIRMNPTADSAGTLGSLDADVSWSTEGIKQTVKGIIPFLGGLVNGVSTNPQAGTLEVQGPLGTVTVKPEVADGALLLTVAGVTGLGFTLPSESVQPALDAFTKTLTTNLPMDIRAESVTVTDTGVNARFITRDATIPNGAQDPCFAGL